MSRHRSAHPRYGRIVLAAAALGVTTVSVLGGVGLVPTPSSAAGERLSVTPPSAVAPPVRSEPEPAPEPVVAGPSMPADAVESLAATVLHRVAPRRLWGGCLVVMAIGVAVGVLVQGMAALVVAALCVGATFVVATLAGLQEARRVAGAAAPRLIAAMTAAFGTGQLVCPVLVGLGAESRE